MKISKRKKKLTKFRNLAKVKNKKNKNQQLRL